MPLSRDLAAWLKDQGHDAEHAADLGLARASDLDILARAKRERRAIVTAESVPTEVKSALQLMRVIQSQSTFVTTDIKAARAWLGLPAMTDFGAEEAA